MPFSLIKLPLYAARLAYEQMGPEQTLEISRLSKKSRESVKKSAVRCKRQSVFFTKENPSIQIEFLMGNYEVVFNRPIPRDKKIRHGRLKGIAFSFANTSPSQMVVVIDRSQLFHLVYHLYDDLAALFPTPMIGQLVVNSDAIKNFILLLSIPEFGKCEAIHLTGNHIELEDVIHVLDTCYIQKTFALKAPTKGRLEHPKLLGFQNLIIWDNDWITNDDWQLTNCRHLSFRHPKINITDCDIVEFVNNWKEDLESIVKSVEIEFQGDARPINTLRSREDIEGGRDDAKYGSWFHTIQGCVQDLRNGQGSLRVFLVNSTTPSYLTKEYPKIVWGDIHWKQTRMRTMTYKRDSEQFSEFCYQGNGIPINPWDFDVVRDDGTIATCQVEGNFFRMMVWPKNNADNN